MGAMNVSSNLLISIIKSKFSLLVRIQFSFKQYYSRKTSLRLLSFLSILFSVLLLVAFKANSLSLMSVFGYAATGGRSCMFLICNGIVGILIKDCSCFSFSSSSSSSLDDDQFSSISNTDNYTADQSTSGTVQGHSIDGITKDVVEEIRRDEHEQQIIIAFDDHYAKKVVVVGEKGRLQGDDYGCELLSLQEANELDREEISEDEQDNQDLEEELELEDEEELSVIEFNTKCEDFIKMMWSEVKAVSFDDVIEFNTKCEDFIKMMWSEVKVVSFDDESV